MTTPDTTQALRDSEPDTCPLCGEASLASEPVQPGCAERENALADR